MSRRGAFVLLVSACVVAGAGYTVWAARRTRADPRVAGGAPVSVPVGPHASVDRARPTLIFRNQIEGPDWGQVALVPTGTPTEARVVVPLRCERAYFAGGAGGRGLCVTGKPGVFATYDADIFGPDFAVAHHLSGSGVPSRARVSPDGRYGAITSFVAGHSYSDGSFATRTTLIDLSTGVLVGNLEEFAVFRDGQPFKSIDFNFWGVTFTADGHFYATLQTGGRTYLVEGGIAAREMRVLRANVECPSLSPDGTRLAFKKRLHGGGILPTVWRFHILDLATMIEKPLAETRSIDDQVEWLDDQHVLYEVTPDVWTVAADGSGEPRRFLRSARAPAVIRTPFTPSPKGLRTLSLPSADLSVALSAAPSPVRVGQDLTYTVVVSNRGPAAAGGVGLYVPLSPGVTFGALDRRSPSSNDSCTFSNGYLSCTLERLASQESWTVAFTVVPRVAGVVRSHVTVDGAQPDRAPDNNRASVTTAVKRMP
jgi:uncharacterized repeat protein (TIGR01451 family)